MRGTALSTSRYFHIKQRRRNSGIVKKTSKELRPSCVLPAELLKRLAKGRRCILASKKYMVIFGLDSTTQQQPKRDITGGMAANQFEMKNRTRGGRHFEEDSKTGNFTNRFCFAKPKKTESQPRGDRTYVVQLFCPRPPASNQAREQTQSHLVRFQEGANSPRCSRP